jgi:hypothetical protein
MIRGQESVMKIEIPAGRIEVEGPKPFRVEYPYGRPGDGFRSFAPENKATCVAYHRGVDPKALEGIRNGNEYRYGPGDARYEEILADMRQNGFRGGDGARLIIHVKPDDTYFAEGNHRMRIALEAGAPTVEIEVRYYGSVDEEYHLIAFDDRDGTFRVDD